MHKGLFFSFLIISLLFIENKTHAQAKREAGFFAGTSYYMGDINPTKQFYTPLPSAGLLFKFQFSDRQCIRFHGIYGQFKGNDVDFLNDFQQERNAAFFASLLDVNVMYEFNFMPFRYNVRKYAFSPFLFGGIGYDFLLISDNQMPNHFVLPFGTGIKYLISRNSTIGLEWSFRKSFRDNIDHIEDPGSSKDKSILSHNDWYSFAGFFITFGLFDQTGECPVYKQK